MSNVINEALSELDPPTVAANMEFYKSDCMEAVEKIRAILDIRDAATDPTEYRRGVDAGFKYALGKVRQEITRARFNRFNNRGEQFLTALDVMDNRVNQIEREQEGQ